MTLETPELDYAYLAEYATVNPSGTLTAVGASFTKLVAPALPAQQLIAIAGRIRVPATWPVAIDLKISIEGPLASTSPEWVTPRMELDATVPPGSGMAYEDRVGVLFAVMTVFPVLGHGLYQVAIASPEDGFSAPWRVLKFEVTGSVTP